MDSIGLEFDVFRLTNDSKIALQNILREKQFKKNVVIYSQFYIDLDSMVVAKTAKYRNHWRDNLKCMRSDKEK